MQHLHVFLILALVFPNLFSAFLVDEVTTVPNFDSDSQCVWYGECDKTGTGKLNCVYNGPPKPLNDSDAVKTLLKYCPHMTTKGYVPLTCCDSNQLKTLQNSIGVAEQILSSCPSCFQNFVKLFCELTCSPQQSKFIHIDKINHQRHAVTSVDYYLSHDFVNGMFSSCQNVTMPATKEKALGVICGRPAPQCSSSNLLNFIGSTQNGQTPFQINFMTTNKNVHVGKKVYVPMNVSTMSCQESCTCRDCFQVCGPSPKPLPCPNGTCFDGHIRPIYRQEQLIITRPRNTETVVHQLPPPSVASQNYTSLFQRDFLHLLLALQEDIFNLTVKFEGEMVKLDDICFKPMGPLGSVCESTSILEYWQSNSAAIDIVKYDTFGFFVLGDYLDHFSSCSEGGTWDPVLNMSCQSSSGRLIYPHMILAGYGDENYNSSVAFVMTFLVNNYQDDRRNNMARAWEAEFKHFIENYSSPNMTVKCATNI